jgi:hypothetical protein
MQVIEVTQNVAVSIPVYMRSTDTGAGISGLATAMVITSKKTGAGFLTITPSITDRDNGWYDLAFTGAMVDTLGFMPLRITAAPGIGQTGAQENDEITVNIIAINKNDAVHMGLSSLPNATAGLNAGLPVVGVQVPLPSAGAAGGLPLVGTQIPLAAAGTNTGLPVIGTQIPLATAGANTGLPVVGTQIPLAAAGADTGLPVVGNQIPNATAGSSDGLAIAEQVANIAVTGAALNAIATSRTIVSGTEVGVLANSDTLDRVFHTFTDVAGAIDFYYEFNIAAIANAAGVSVQWMGYLNTAGNTMKVYAWNWTSLAWDQLGFIAGSGDTVAYGGEYALTNSHSSGGLVRIRFANTGLTTATFATDRILLGYVVLPASTSVTVAAILDALLTGHAVVGSIADGIAIAAGLLQGNFFMDQTDNTSPNGQTAARMRIFRDGVATAAATDGGVAEGEFATFLVTTTYVGPNKIATHRVVRQ